MYVGFTVTRTPLRPAFPGDCMLLMDEVMQVEQSEIRPIARAIIAGFRPESGYTITVTGWHDERTIVSFESR